MNIDKTIVGNEVLLDVNITLQTFRRSTAFQQGIVSVILSFHQRFDEMDRLRKIFIALDKSNDGMLTMEEIHEGLVQVMGNVKGNMREFQELMLEVDQDGDGLIDYSEFLAASVNKAKLLTSQNL